MREYFTIMIKENDTSNLKLLTEKLNDGFHVEDRIEVGRSTVVTLQRRVRDNIQNSRVEAMQNHVDTMLDTISSGSTASIPF